jgi:hypothetical protein
VSKDNGRSAQESRCNERTRSLILTMSSCIHDLMILLGNIPFWRTGFGLSSRRASIKLYSVIHAASNCTSHASTHDPRQMAMLLQSYVNGSFFSTASVYTFTPLSPTPHTMNPTATPREHLSPNIKQPPPTRATAQRYTTMSSTNPTVPRNASMPHNSAQPYGADLQWGKVCFTNELTGCSEMFNLGHS